MKMEARAYEVAARWFFRCGDADCSAEEMREFERWLEASPNHLAAFLLVEEAWQEAGEALRRR